MSDFAAIRQIIPTKSNLDVLASALKNGFLTSSRDSIAVRYLPKNEEFMTPPSKAEKLIGVPEALLQQRRDRLVSLTSLQPQGYREFGSKGH